MARSIDLVDRYLSVHVSVGFRFGDLPADKDEEQLRTAQRGIIKPLVDDIEQQALDTIAEALGYDSDRLAVMMTERADRRAAAQEAEQAGRDLRNRQR